MIATASLLALATAAAHAAQRYRLTDLGVDTLGVRMNGGGQVIGWRNNLPAKWNGSWENLQGSSDFQPSALNDQGFAVGWQGAGLPKGVEWAPNDNYKYVIHGAVEGVATIIDKDGAVYGSTQMQSGHSFPYVKEKKKVSRFPYLPGYDWTVPMSVNRFQEMAGFAGADAAGSVCPAVPVVYQNGSWTSIGLLGGSCGQANGLNDGGVAVGWSNTSGFYSHAFVWQNGIMTDLGALGGNENSIAWDITQDGVIVGDSGTRAFIYQNGVMTALSSLVNLLPRGVKLESGRSINGKGQILVNGRDKNNHSHAYRLDPL